LNLTKESSILIRSQDHGTSGPVHLTYGDAWIPKLGDIYTAAEQVDLATNPDINSGNPMGLGMGSCCIYKGQRLTSSIAYLSQPLSNLSILPNSGVSKVIFDDKRAIGIETFDGRKFYATKDVILSGGALNTPQILMLSGVGPEEELQKHGIPLLHNLPMVGKNLQDHCYSSIGIVMKRDARSPTGGLVQNPSPMGWFKSSAIFESDEYKSLPDQTKIFLQKPTTPGFEIATVINIIYRELQR
jgi:choline dehydrogenase-like flavoprotein